jgi:hypothetical protein
MGFFDKTTNLASSFVSENVNAAKAAGEKVQQ